MRHEITPPIEIKGDGTSLWGSSDGTYTITHWGIDYKSGTHISVNVYGTNLKGNHYTDRGIEAEVKRHLKPLIEKVFNGRPLKSLTWSEYGMQRKSSWNFDGTLKKKEKDDSSKRNIES